MDLKLHRRAATRPNPSRQSKEEGEGEGEEEEEETAEVILPFPQAGSGRPEALLPSEARLLSRLLVLKARR